MTYEERRTVVRQQVDPVAPAETTGNVIHERRVATQRPSGLTLASRIVILLFGIVQLVIGLRILLLALDARHGNALVAGILNLSQLFVMPFEGILNTNALGAGGAVLDLAAILALLGWTALELVVLAILRVGRSGDEV